MIASFAYRLFEGVFAPRRSARWMLGRAPTLKQSLLMVCFGVVFSQITYFVGVELIYQQRAQDMDMVLSLFINLAVSLLTVGMVSGLAFRLGARKGGGAGYGQIAGLVAWWTIVGALISPLLIIAFSEFLQFPEGYQAASEEVLAHDLRRGAVQLSGPAFISFFALGLYHLWILSSYVAVAHGFKSTGSVMISAIALFFGFSLMLGLVTAILGGG